MKLWDASTSRHIRTLHGKSPVKGVAFSPDGTSIGCACTDGIVRIWDLATGEEVATLTGHSDSVQLRGVQP